VAPYRKALKEKVGKLGSKIATAHEPSSASNMPSDAQLLSDVRAIHEQFLTDASGRADSGERGRRTTAVAVLLLRETNKRQKVYAVSSNKIRDEVKVEAERRGYKRIFGVAFTAEKQTHAEQIIINYALKYAILGETIDTPIAPSREACGPDKQDCQGRVQKTPGFRLV
jgi:hypothetical protein